jgi:hypothetical protein
VVVSDDFDAGGDDGADGAVVGAADVVVGERRGDVF